MKIGFKLLRACALSSALLLLVSAANGCALIRAEEHFSVREYNEFHEVLHELQHEAWPKKDYQTIRAKAPELVSRGEAIIKLGVPDGVKDAADFEKQLKTFGDALAKFKQDAASGSDESLAESYPPVHDSFEMLAEMLPAKKS